MTINREADPKGDRVKLGKFLPFKHYDGPAARSSRGMRSRS